MSTTPPADDARSCPGTRALLDHFSAGPPDEVLPLGDVFVGLGRRSFGMLLFVSILPAFVPIPGFAGAASGLPGVIVVAIFAVAGILLALFIVQSTRSRKAHLLVTVGLVALVSLGSAMVLSLARPFGGPANIDTAFNDELSQSYIECDRRNMPQSVPMPAARRPD